MTFLWRVLLAQLDLWRTLRTIERERAKGLRQTCFFGRLG